METITVPTDEHQLTLIDMALAGAAAASAGAPDLIEASRGDMPIGLNLVHREAAENLADALRAVLAIQITDGATGIEPGKRHREDQLLAAVQEFLEGWEA